MSTGWSRSIGTGGRDPSERVVTIVGMRRDPMHDQLAREEMLRLASKYERLADWTEERNRPRFSSAPIAR
jgi:hypothetical protein